MATFRTLSMLKQMSTTWCRRKHAFVCSSYSTRPPKSEDKPVDSASKDKRSKLFVKAKPKKVLEIHSIIKPSSVVSKYRECEETGGGELDKDAVKMVLEEFSRSSEIRTLCRENDISPDLFRTTFQSFSTMCLEDKLRFDIHLLLNILTIDKGDVGMLFPYYLGYSQEMFPHLKSMNMLKGLTDLTSPAQWYVETRAKTRKIVMHVGPTNSGKTYHAMKRFLKAESATYCCPLRLLAMEICNSSNDQGVPCDLKTGELVTFADENNQPGNHVACTVEMTNLKDNYDVAVIDEIQMIQNLDRGWAWTQAFLGLKADEIHVCGEEAAVPLIKNLAVLTGDTVEVNEYTRLNPLMYLSTALEKYENVMPGDCIICFSKEVIFDVSAELNKRGVLTAIIYGNLPPATKIAQAKQFNDPLDPCKVLVATDAVGLGLNLNIRRIVFHSLSKGNRRWGRINSSLVRHIAGRAGRFGHIYPKGYVTTFKKSDLYSLHELKNEKVIPIQSAGLQPTPEQMELFSNHLPDASLKNLLIMFEHMAKHDKENFFMCELNQMKKLAELIDNIGLPTKDKFQYSHVPVDTDSEVQCDFFVQCATKHFYEEPISISWLTSHLGWPLEMPTTVADLKDMETIFNCLDVYLWLSKCYPNIYQDEERVREIQKELEIWIEDGLKACLFEKLNLAQKRKLEMQTLKRKISSDNPEKQELEKPAARSDSAKSPKRDEKPNDKNNDMLDLIKFLKKGGMSEKRFKTLSKQLQFDPNFISSQPLIGKHPMKTRPDKMKVLKYLEKMEKDKYQK
ncbi:ATP-dependent RNA helicase SUV3 homolog, mitochondrial-like [Mizuhopecten yessoensis]|uniref:RNA helicase n=1 Tax=Mizuhopecten yessoensis TaxID=6573 RepID=A0A210PPA2_MIZYE|nr:ATP-dependent RNA helicase SUV3 homolog, mitochondrial-like [Mizuhopecten yessoensis]OWF38311.1 ATP-dependent RNA helicase SUV3-like [Mizuhopecten yessoensis]